MTITPNQLTWFRLIVAPTVPIVFNYGGNEYKLWACVIFVTAALTDLVDGFLARRRQQITSMGKILDPIADKVLVLGALVAFAMNGVLNAWWLLPIVLRELSVTIARFMLLSKKEVVASTPSGKKKVVIQYATVFLFFLLSLKLDTIQGSLENALKIAAHAMLTMATWSTLKSGYDFFAANGGKLIERKNR